MPHFIYRVIRVIRRYYSGFLSSHVMSENDVTAGPLVSRFIHSKAFNYVFRSSLEELSVSFFWILD